MIKTQNSLLTKVVLYFLLGIGVIISVGPFYWMLVGATNKSGEIFSIPPKVIPGDYLIENFKHLSESIGILQVLGNSVFIAVTFTVVSLLFCSAAGFAFAKYKFKGKELIFFALLLAIMIPYQVTLIPLFQLFADIGWLNQYIAVILPQLAYPFAIFLMRQNMQSIPDSLIEAARADGAGEFYIFFRIALPVMKPALAAVSIFLFTFQWNNFIWPLVVLNTEDMYTMPIALASLAGMSRIDYGQIMLGTTLSTLPVMAVFLFLQKYFISGILGGAVKE